MQSYKCAITKFGKIASINTSALSMQIFNDIKQLMTWLYRKHVISCLMSLKICIDKADVFIDAIFPNLVIAHLYDCMFKISMIFKLLLIFVSKILIAVLYHCMFKYVLFFSPDETLEQGRNASQ